MNFAIIYVINSRISLRNYPMILKVIIIYMPLLLTDLKLKLIKIFDYPREHKGNHVQKNL
jgi:hypothetical protein